MLYRSFVAFFTEGEAECEKAVSQMDWNNAKIYERIDGWVRRLSVRVEGERSRFFSINKNNRECHALVLEQISRSVGCRLKVYIAI